MDCVTTKCLQSFESSNLEYRKRSGGINIKLCHRDLNYECGCWLEVAKFCPVAWFDIGSFESLMFKYSTVSFSVINPFPSLTLQNARNLKVPSPSKCSKAFLV